MGRIGTSLLLTLTMTGPEGGGGLLAAVVSLEEVRFPESSRFNRGDARASNALLSGLIGDAGAFGTRGDESGGRRAV